MSSYPKTVNLLKYLRSRSNVDCDSLDLRVSKDLGPFVDCTSNQADSYMELLVPHRTDILKNSAALGRQLQSEYPGIKYEELAVEIAMVQLSQTLAPLISGNILIMCNPTLKSTKQIVENAQRIASLCQRLHPEFDIERLCVKVVSTWEGLQACHELTRLGIKTLATTLFTMEQVILAGEVGCAYISPFVHELKAIFDTTYDDGGANLELCVEAQQYYKKNSYNTRVKAAGLLSKEEAKKLAGVDYVTIAPDILYELSKAEEPEDDLTAVSLFHNTAKQNRLPEERQTFINNEDKYAAAFDKRDSGKGKWRTRQAIDIFCEYQDKALTLMIENDLGEPNGKI